MVECNGSFVVVEVYVLNIVWVMILIDCVEVDVLLGLGLNVKVDGIGWVCCSDVGVDVFMFVVFVLIVEVQFWFKVLSQMEWYFVLLLLFVVIIVCVVDGIMLMCMIGWEMVLYIVNEEKMFCVGVNFVVLIDEYYYGFGQNQEGVFDLCGCIIDCCYNYDVFVGEMVCVFFLVINKGYGIVWDNLLQMMVLLGFYGLMYWQLNVGEWVLFFVIMGKIIDDFYVGYVCLIGVMLLFFKVVFGLLQSKVCYEMQVELFGIVEGYWSCGLLFDVMVFDWFYWIWMGQMDIDWIYFFDFKWMNVMLKIMGV